MPVDDYSKKEQQYMTRAINLARCYQNLTGYDPAVGCLIVKNGRVLASGAHRQVSTPHAETVALKIAGKAARGADLFINLEPCAHWGNNPPCADALIKAGIKRVFAATGDPNPLVNGAGFKKLRSAGIEVRVGLLENQARRLNEAFFKFIRNKIPFVTLKIAQSLDGKIATASGQSQWITGAAARKYTHYLRSIHRAILAGTRTILKDDPELTARLVPARHQPLRVVLDAAGEIPLSARVFNAAAPTILVISEKFPSGKLKQLQKKEIETIKLPEKNGFFDLKLLLKILGRKNIASLMVEGGSEILGSFISRGLADKMVIMTAPLIIGGQQSLSAVGGREIKTLDEAVRLKNMTFRELDADLLIEGYFF